MKRLFLFLATNLAVMVVMSVALRLLGVDRFLTANGLDVGAPMIFSLAIGLGGSFISLPMSKRIAKWSTGARVIEHPQSAFRDASLVVVAWFSRHREFRRTPRAVGALRLRPWP